MRQNNHQIREVHADVIGKHGLRVEIAGARKNRRACMNHHGHSVGLRAFVHGRLRAEAITIGVRSH